MSSALDEILETFEYLDDWEDRYKYLIDLGRGLPTLSAEAHNDANKVRGCVSQVWLQTRVTDSEQGEKVLTFEGDSDALIVKGLIAIALAMFSGRTASKILDTDVDGVFSQIGLREHLTPQRSNGLSSMVARIKNDARAALAGAASDCR